MRERRITSGNQETFGPDADDGFTVTYRPHNLVRFYTWNRYSLVYFNKTFFFFFLILKKKHPFWNHFLLSWFSATFEMIHNRDLSTGFLAENRGLVFSLIYVFSSYQFGFNYYYFGSPDILLVYSVTRAKKKNLLNHFNFYLKICTAFKPGHMQSCWLELCRWLFTSNEELTSSITQFVMFVTFVSLYAIIKVLAVFCDSTA